MNRRHQIRRIDLIHAVTEYAFAVKSIELIDAKLQKVIDNDNTTLHPALRVTTFEDVTFIIETRDSGFLVCCICEIGWSTACIVDISFD